MNLLTTVPGRALSGLRIRRPALVSMVACTLLAGNLELVAAEQVGQRSQTDQAQAKPAHPVGGTSAQMPRHLLWSELVPKGWDPMAKFRKRFADPKLAMMDDADPKIMAMMRELREIWDKAPVNAEMDGVSGKLPGYVVPLDDGRKGMRTFLLVPYYGACIHSPPPPANQIVLVRSSKPIKGFQSMDTVWVHGTLEAFRGDSVMGVSGWRIDARKVEAYERPPVDAAP